mmetsp:Transcript_95448/g.267343  ORF Transcript_95448/g.267343 Transcript_95448/m.267343 type:complete len:269 (-) Transcript_95448:6-812(-)
MNRTTIVLFNLGFMRPNSDKNLVINATWPKQSVVPRPKSLPSSSVSSKGSLSQVLGSAGTTSKWLPTNAIVLSVDPGYVTFKLERPGVYSNSSMIKGPPFSFEKGASSSITTFAARFSSGTMPRRGLFCKYLDCDNNLRNKPMNRALSKSRATPPILDKSAGCGDKLTSDDTPFTCVKSSERRRCVIGDMNANGDHGALECRPHGEAAALGDPRGMMSTLPAAFFDRKERIACHKAAPVKQPKPPIKASAITTTAAHGNMRAGAAGKA